MAVKSLYREKRALTLSEQLKASLYHITLRINVDNVLGDILLKGSVITTLGKLTTCVTIPAPLLAGCVSTGKVLNLSVLRIIYKLGIIIPITQRRVKIVWGKCLVPGKKPYKKLYGWRIFILRIRKPILVRGSTIFPAPLNYESS